MEVTGMRRWAAAIILAALASAAAPGAVRAANAPKRVPLRITAFDTHSGILVTHFSFLQVQTREPTGEIGHTFVTYPDRVTTSACVSFVNTLPRNVTAVDFHFVFYDRLHNHAGDAELVRSGSFAPNVPADVNFANRSGIEDPKDCVMLPRHDPPLELAVVFVKSATFADGSQWATSGPAIAEHLDP